MWLGFLVTLTFYKAIDYVRKIYKLIINVMETLIAFVASICNEADGVTKKMVVHCNFGSYLGNIVGLSFMWHFKSFFRWIFIYLLNFFFRKLLIEICCHTLVEPRPKFNHKALSIKFLNIMSVLQIGKCLKNRDRFYILKYVFSFTFKTYILC